MSNAEQPHRLAGLIAAICETVGKPGWIGHLLAFFAGALITLSFAPFNIWPCTLLGMLVFTLSLQQVTSRQAIVRGWSFGSGLFLSGASWVYVSIHLHGNASVPLAGFLTAAFCMGLGLCISLVAYLYVRFLRGRPGHLLFGIPLLWMLGEWFRCWFLTGFPWLFLGYSQVDGPLAAWAPVIGTMGISALLALSSASVAQWMLGRTLSASYGIGLSLLLWLLAIHLGMQQWVHAADKPPLKVAAVQANIPQEQKWDPGFLLPTYRLYQDLTEQNWDADLIVWPETSIPRLFHRAQSFITRMDDLAQKHHSAIIAGIPYSSPEDRHRYYNSIIAFGDGQGVYHKKRLVPFGEYVPLEDMLRGLIEFFNLPMSNFSVGPDKNVLLDVHGIKLAPFICYEVVYPDLVNENLPAADVLITISNDTWFGDSHGPLQHMQMAQMRALETGRYLIRGTNNGVTALVDYHGKIITALPQFTRGVLRGEVKAMQGLTPYANWGDTPLLLLCGLGFVVIALRQPKVEGSA